MSIPVIPGLTDGLNIGGVQVNQQPATVLNLEGAKLLNHSGIGTDGGKLKKQPPNWSMCEPYREQWSQTETTIVATWIGPWDELKSFVDFMLGYSSSVILPLGVAGELPPPLPPGFDAGGHILNNPGAAGSPALLREPPAQHPKYPWLYAVDCQVAGEGVILPDPECFVVDASGNVLLSGVPPKPALQEMIYFGNNIGRSEQGEFGAGAARVQVTYQALDYEIRKDNDPVVGQFGELARWVSRYWEPAIQALPIAGQLAQQVVFNDPRNPIVGGAVLNGVPPVVNGLVNGLPIPEAGVLLMPTRSCRWLWRQVPDVPWVNLAALEGHTNDAPFDGVPGHPTYPKGTLLMQASSIKRTPRTPAGRVCFDIEYRADFRPQGWNFFPYLDFNFYRATFKDGSLIFKEADFTKAFAPPPPAQYQ